MSTGKFYRFYSEKPINAVFSLFKERMSCIDYISWQRRDDDGEEVIFFYKNKKMLDHHEENGYNLDLGGQGCFCIEAQTVKCHGIASLYEFSGKSDFNPYSINLMFDNICYYLMILPDLIEESGFCKDIFNNFARAIKDT